MKQFPFSSFSAIFCLKSKDKVFVAVILFRRFCWKLAKEIFVVAMMTPLIDVDRVNQLSGFLNTFFVSQAAVVSVFMGATAYSKRNNDISVQAKKWKWKI